MAFAGADELTSLLLEPLVKELGLSRGAGVIALVNGLGGTYPLELSVAARAMYHQLAALGITVARSLVGSYATTFDMLGFSITLLPADGDLSIGGGPAQ